VTLFRSDGPWIPNRPSPTASKLWIGSTVIFNSDGGAPAKPEGFASGMTVHNVLTGQYAHHPAPAHLFGGLGAVENQGLGVDGMYRGDGHPPPPRPPLIVEDGGPRVQVRLVGGHPVVHRPRPRRRADG
jgi:hypothetical protein